MDFVIPQLHVNFEVASFSHSRNIKGEPQIWETTLSDGHAHFLLLTGWSSYGGLSFESLVARVIQMVFLVGRWMFSFENTRIWGKIGF